MQFVFNDNILQLQKIYNLYNKKSSTYIFDVNSILANTVFKDFNFQCITNINSFVNNMIVNVIYNYTLID